MSSLYKVTGMLRGITVEEYGEVMKKEGFEDGKAEGLEQGRNEGIAQGEASKATEMARAMKAENIDIDTIAKVSGLPVEDIEKL